jgi:hypothetical protein
VIAVLWDLWKLLPPWAKIVLPIAAVLILIGQIGNSLRRQQLEKEALKALRRSNRESDGVRSVPSDTGFLVCARCGATAHLAAALFCGKCGASLSDPKTAGAKPNARGVN